MKKIIATGVLAAGVLIGAPAMAHQYHTHGFTHHHKGGYHHHQHSAALSGAGASGTVTTSWSSHGGYPGGAILPPPPPPWPPFGHPGFGGIWPCPEIIVIHPPCCHWGW